MHEGFVLQRRDFYDIALGIAEIIKEPGFLVLLFYTNYYLWLRPRGKKDLKVFYDTLKK